MRALLREALDDAKRTGKGRAEVARHMTELLDRRVSESMLADFTRNSTPERNIRFPLEWTDAFCEATGSNELRLFLLGPEQRSIFEAGERVRRMAWMLEKLRTDVAMLAAQGGTARRGKGKRPRRSGK